jgi:chaperone BCS1
MLINWISEQPFAQNTRTTLVSVGAKHRRGLFDNANGDKKSLSFTPWNTSIVFIYKGHLIRFRRAPKDGRSGEEEIVVSCYGRSPRIVKELFEECRTEYLKQIEKKTTVFDHQGGEWRKTMSREIRPLSTILMDEKKKQKVLNDVESFLDPAARGWYARRGIPYRRGFLLYGPPGTGKSSFSLSIAGQFDLDIYILNLSAVDDSGLSSLFSELPSRCVVLLEDVDAAGTTRTEQTAEKTTDQIAATSKGLTLSGLLNAIDGVSSQEGRVLIMTTNHIEHLDAALIRPGRVDRKVLFQLTDKDMNARLFCIIFKQSTEDQHSPKGDIDEETVGQLAIEFAGKIPERVFSPAEVLSYLLENKLSPTKAVANVERWVKDNENEDGESLKRELSWASDSA